MDFTLVGKTVALVAKRNSGKSYLIRYLVKQQLGNFAKVYVICPTERLNGFYKDSGIVEDNCIFTEYSEKWVNALIEKLTKLREQGKKMNVLLILGDIVADTRLHFSDTIRVLYVRGRHKGISVLMTTQSITLVPPVCRSNADFICIGQIYRASIELAAQEFSAGPIDKKGFLQLYHENTKNHSFLIISNNSVKDSSNLNEIYGSIKVPEDNI